MRLSRTTVFDLLITSASLVLLISWDASGLDLTLARPFATAQGFGLREHWLLAHGLHEGARYLAWLPGLWLIAGIWWPTGVLRQLARPQRIQWAATTLLALILISAIKQVSLTSCPWDLAEFGGRAAWVSHWTRGVVDGGGGHCFPAGHASSGFAFIGGYFVLRHRVPKQARRWLVGSLLAGLLLGAIQQLRGAHFMSHTAWTGWLCWTLAWLVDSAGRQLMPNAWQTAPEARTVPNPDAARR